MDIHSHDNNNIFLLIISLLFGITGLLEIKPILDLIFIILAIVGLIVTISINVKKLFKE